MKHVFVETNWVVDYAAPGYARVPAATQLASDAADGKVTLHLPSCCLAEARQPLLVKYRPKAARIIRQFLQWAHGTGNLQKEDIDTTRKVLDNFEQQVNKDLDDLDSTLQRISQLNGIEVFSLNETMLKRTSELAVKNLDLKPWDSAILAAILVRCEELWNAGENDLNFCEQDSDLLPWDRDGNPRQGLKELYSVAHLKVFADFKMRIAPKP